MQKYLEVKHVEVLRQVVSSRIGNPDNINEVMNRGWYSVPKLAGLNSHFLSHNTELDDELSQIMGRSSSQQSPGALDHQVGISQQSPGALAHQVGNTVGIL